MTPQADWVKEIEEIYQEIRKEIMVSNGAVMVNWDDGTPKVKKPNGRIMIKNLLTLAQQRTEKKWREKIKTHMFMFEHQAIMGEALCETCREVVTNSTPCTASPYYKTWLDLSDLLK